MSKLFNTIQKPHLNTTNVYVQQQIILQNLKDIDYLLNNRKGLNISNKIYWEIVAIKKTQKGHLKHVETNIKKLVQRVFSFGG